jgi:hypothetical protein
MSFPPLGLGLSLRRGGLLRWPGRRLRGEIVSDITGNPEFDRAVLVKCADPTQLAPFLDAGRRAVVLGLFQEYPGARISDGLIRWSSKRLDSPDLAGVRVRALVKAATMLSRRDFESSLVPRHRHEAEERTETPHSAARSRASRGVLTRAVIDGAGSQLKPIPRR